MIHPAPRWRDYVLTSALSDAWRRISGPPFLRVDFFLDSACFGFDRGCTGPLCCAGYRSQVDAAHEQA